MTTTRRAMQWLDVLKRKLCVPDRIWPGHRLGSGRSRFSEHSTRRGGPRVGSATTTDHPWVYYDPEV